MKMPTSFKNTIRQLRISQYYTDYKKGIHGYHL